MLVTNRISDKYRAKITENVLLDFLCSRGTSWDMLEKENRIKNEAPKKGHLYTSFFVITLFLLSLIIFVWYVCGVLHSIILVSTNM